MKAQSKCFPITRNARRWWIAVALLAAPVVSLAQTDEIQVYDANIADKGKFNLMIHNNFTPDGRKTPDFPGGVESNHALVGVAEWAYGVGFRALEKRRASLWRKTEMQLRRNRVQHTFEEHHDG